MPIGKSYGVENGATEVIYTTISRWKSI